MTVSAIRQRLMGYLADADDKKVKALYTLLENEIGEDASNVFTSEQLAILNEEHELHVTGKSKSYSWNETKDIIRGKKVI